MQVLVIDDQHFSYCLTGHDESNYLFMTQPINRHPIYLENEISVF
jgi:hypothetical protein